MHDKPQTFLTVVDQTSVHRQVLHGVAIRVRSFEFTTGAIYYCFSKQKYILFFIPRIIFSRDVGNSIK